MYSDFIYKIWLYIKISLGFPCPIKRLIIIKRFNTSSKKKDISIKLNDSLHPRGKKILLKN